MRTRVHRYVRACVRVPVYRCACLVCTRVSVCASVNAVYACRVSASVCRDMRLVWTGTRVHVRVCIVHTCMCVNAPCIAPCVCVCACLRACTRAFACASRVRTGALCVCVRVCAQAYVGLVAVGGLPRPVSLCGGALLWPRGRSHHRTPSAWLTFTAVRWSWSHVMSGLGERPTQLQSDVETSWEMLDLGL